MISQSEMITALADDYQNVFVLEPEKDACFFIKQYGKMEDLSNGQIKEFPYLSRLASYAERRVVKEDRKAFLEMFGNPNLIAKLKEGEKLEFSYRANIDGKLEHYTGLYIRVSNPGEPLRVVAGFRNVDDIVYAESRKLSEGALRAYSAMGDIYLCMYRVDLKSDLYDTIKASPRVAQQTPSKYFSGNVGSVVENLVVEESKPEAALFLDVKTLPKRMKGKNHLSIHFNSRFAGSVRLHFIKEDEDEKGNLHHVLFAVEIADETKYQSVFDVLASEYQNVFYFNVDTGKGRVMKSTSMLEEAAKGRDFDYESLFESYLALFVPEEEWDGIRAKASLPSLRRAMASQDSLQGGFHAKVEGKLHSYTYDYRKMKEQGYLVCGFRCVDQIIEEHQKEERKKKEREEAFQKRLDESYAKLSEKEDILKASKMGTWRITLLEGKKPTMVADDLMKDLLGIKGKELTPEEIYDAWYDNITPEALPSVLSSVAKMETEGYDENTYLWKHPILGLRYVRCGGTAYQVKGGYVLRGYHYDVDETMREAKEKEEKLKKATASDKKREQVIAAIAKIYTTIFLADCSTHRFEIVSTVPMLRKALKGIRDFDEAARIAFPTIIAEDCVKDMASFVDLPTLPSRLSATGTIATEFRDPAGSWFEARFIAKSFAEDGTLEEALFVSRNISKEKEAELAQEEALRDALALARHASRAKTTFLNNMSHDIRTPMNAIIGFTALAETHLGSQELVKDYLGKIHTSSTHLLSLINEILDMSRIESGTVKLEENHVHLPDVLHDLRTMIQGQVSAKSQNLYIDTLDLVHEDIVTDKLRLNQVLLNIVGNAIKYTGIGGNIFIRVSELPCKKEGMATYRFSVKDNGIGMSAEFKATVFEAFSREHSSTVSGVQGTGLGMSITKNIVDLMGGEIEVESEQGKGSEFVVTVDFLLSEGAIDYAPIPTLEGARALVVDDDIYTCQSVSKMLRDISMRPDWSTSGKEAIVRAKEASELQDEYKVYIIDYLMPDMNGIETVRQIRKVIGEEIPIIILSAYDWSDVEDEARQAGVTAFIAKPIFLSELRSILSSPAKKQEEKTEERPDFSGKRVLLVEDNDLNREIATELLKEMGLEVECACDGIEAVNALDRAEEGRFDLVLMDIQMPRMDGYTATREIRTLPSNSKANVPIVAMTANAFEEDRQKAFEAGMNGHIAKPIDLKAIAATLKAIFAK